MGRLVFKTGKQLNTKIGTSSDGDAIGDAAYSTANWTDIDAQTSFNEDCSSVVGIKQYTSSKTLIKTLNIMGRETTFKPNTLLINVYDDGSVEKAFTKGLLNN